MAKSGVGATRDPLWYCVETYEWRQFGEEVKFVWLFAINKGIDKVIEITCSGQDGKLCDSLLKVEAGHFFLPFVVCGRASPQETFAYPLLVVVR